MQPKSTGLQLGGLILAGTLAGHLHLGASVSSSVK